MPLRDSDPARGASVSAFKPGDVVSYLAERSHCREGTAFITDAGRAVDTYWRTCGDGDSHVLTADELATAKVRFNVNDYDALDRRARETWETYHPADRGRITSQHGLQEALYVRKGAQPDLETQIKRAQERVESAVREVHAAQRSLGWRQDELDALLDGAR